MYRLLFLGLISISIVILYSCPETPSSLSIPEYPAQENEIEPVIEDKIEEKNEGWLVLIHFATDNNIDYIYEKDGQIITNYIETLENIEALDIDGVVDILVLMDCYDESDPAGTGYISPFKDGYYSLTGGDFSNDLAFELEEINSGSVLESMNFIDWVYDNYNRENIFYSIFNHGGGFNDENIDGTFSVDSRGIGFDDSDNDALSHRELSVILSYIKDKQGKLLIYSFLMAA